MHIAHLPKTEEQAVPTSQSWDTRTAREHLRAQSVHPIQLTRRRCMKFPRRPVDPLFDKCDRMELERLTALRSGHLLIPQWRNRSQAFPIRLRRNRRTTVEGSCLLLLGEPA